MTFTLFETETALAQDVFASEAKQSRAARVILDCFVAIAPRNDDKNRQRMTLIIRPALPHEHDAIAKVWMQSWCSTGLEAESDALLAALKARVPYEVAQGWSLYAAIDQGTIAAMLAIHIPQLYLDQLFIAPAYQGRSLGRRLLAFTKDLLPDEIWLRCVRENEKAWRWYEREGFVLEKQEIEPRHNRMMKYYRWKRTGRI